MPTGLRLPRGVSSSTLAGMGNAGASGSAVTGAAASATDRPAAVAAKLARCSVSVTCADAIAASDATPAASTIRKIARGISVCRKVKLWVARPLGIDVEAKSGTSSGYSRARRPTKYPTKSAPATVTIGRARIDALAASVSRA